MNQSINATLSDRVTGLDLQKFIEFTTVAVPTIIGFLLVAGLLGNILVIKITITTKRLQKHPIHSILVLNLAIADLVHLLASGPWQAIYATVPKWIYGAFCCKAFNYLNILTMAVSIFTMCSLALMRFLALMMPFKMQRRLMITSEKAVGIFIAAVVWAIAAIVALPFAIFYNLIGEDMGMAQCAWEDMYADRINSILLLIFTYIIPLLLVSVLYFFISRKMLYGMTARPPNRNRRQYVKTTAMVLVLIVAFLVCWFPHHLFAMMLVSKRFNGDDYAIMKSTIEVVGHCMAYAHACVNPVIYTFASPGFRRNLPFSSRRSGIQRQRPEVKESIPLAGRNNLAPDNHKTVNGSLTKESHL